MVQVPSLAQELPQAMGVVKKKKEQERRKEGMLIRQAGRQVTEINLINRVSAQSSLRLGCSVDFTFPFPLFFFLFVIPYLPLEENQQQNMLLSSCSYTFFSLLNV